MMNSGNMRPYENETWLITVRKTYYDRLVRDAKGWLKDHHMGGGIAEEMVDKTFDTITLIGRDPGEHLRETVKRRLDRAWREGRNESVPTIPTPSAIADAGWSNPDYAYGPDYERWFELVTRTYESPLKDYAAARAEDLGLAVDEAVTIADAVLAEIKRRGQDVPDDPDEKAPIYWYLRGAVLNACRTEATKSGKRKPLDGGSTRKLTRASRRTRSSVWRPRRISFGGWQTLSSSARPLFSTGLGIIPTFPSEPSWPWYAKSTCRVEARSSPSTSGTQPS